MTLHDRSLCVHLQRRRRDEEVKELRLDRIDDAIARRCARWAKDNESAFASADPEMPYEIFNRVGDNWRPLLAIADLAGGEWPDRLRHIAVRIALIEEGENPSEGERLLRDIHEVMEGSEWITPTELVRELRKLECTITEKGLATKLAPYRIKSKKQRWPDIGMEVQRRYLTSDFADAFSRYLNVPDVPLVPAKPDVKEEKPLKSDVATGTNGTSGRQQRNTTKSLSEILMCDECVGECIETPEPRKMTELEEIMRNSVQLLKGPNDLRINLIIDYMKGYMIKKGLVQKRSSYRRGET
jgi:hypothetical protein